MKKNLLQLVILEILIVCNAWAQSDLHKTSDLKERVMSLDYNKTEGNFNTMFKECIGAGRANEGLRADWQQ